MHVPAVTLLTVFAASLAASSLPVYEGMRFAHGEPGVLARDPTVLESIVRRAKYVSPQYPIAPILSLFFPILDCSGHTLARAVDLAERALVDDMVAREDGHPDLEERMFPLFSAFIFIGKGDKALVE